MADKEPTEKIELNKDNQPKVKLSRKRKARNRSQRFKEKQPRVDYEPIVKDNVALVKYYKQQSIFDPDEFEYFMSGLRETLPASFRINTFDIGQAHFLRSLVGSPKLYEFLSDSTTDTKNLADEAKPEDNLALSAEENQNINQESILEPNGKLVSTNNNEPAVLQALAWYPQKLAWQMNISRLDLRKSPILRRLQKFLMAETDNGFISRQEAVSMIPPLLLDVHKGHNVLDMCAAPGSKTAQLLEYLKNDIMSSSSESAANFKLNYEFDDGIVVANDVDNKRCYMLVHQSSRLNSPNCIIINQDAARLPRMKTFANDGDNYVDIMFDRILCDVPCSGDGTVRKNPDVWKKWTVGNANNFHGMQVKILRRGIELLKENGSLVYSTCSMNPVEDEAVIASILRASQGKVVLEDIAHRLPALKYKAGVSKWVVMNRESEIIESIDKVPPENATQIYPSLFPPSEEESKSFNLNRCIRILPHLQNTGGFFVAVLKKLAASPLPWEEDFTPTKTSDKAGGSDGDDTESKPAPKPNNPKKQRGFRGAFREDPFFFMDAEDADWINIKNCYGLSDSFPVNQLVHRCVAGKKRGIYLVSKRTRSFIIANREEPGRRDFVKIINGGMRLFNRADTESGFRICQDGVNEVLPYIKNDIKVPITKGDLIALLKTRAVGFDQLSASQHIKDKIKPGSFILIYKIQIDQFDDSEGQDENENGRGKQIEVPLVAWKGEVTVALYVANTYRVHLCALAGLKMDDDGGAIKPVKMDGDDNDDGGAIKPDVRREIQQ